jgi:hypothetical protein
MKTLALVLVLGLTSLFSPPARAGGGIGVRGGGDIVELNGKWVLADLLAPSPSPEVYALAPKLRGVLEDLRARISRYADLEGARIWDAVLATDVEYRFVDALPCPLEERADESAGTTFGCTEGARTWLLKAEFSKLDVRQQLLAILHERAHALDLTPESHAWIRPWIRAVATFLAISLEQEAGSTRTLEAAEIAALEPLFTSELRERIGAGNPYRWMLGAVAFVIQPRGGGVIAFGLERGTRGLPVPSLDDTSFLSIDSALLYDTACRLPSAPLASMIIRSSVLSCLSGAASSFERAGILLGQEPRVWSDRGSIEISVTRSSLKETVFLLARLPRPAFSWSLDRVTGLKASIDIRSEEPSVLAWERMSLPASRGALLDRADPALPDGRELTLRTEGTHPRVIRLRSDRDRIWRGARLTGN